MAESKIRIGNGVGNIITLNSYIEYQIVMPNLLMVKLSYDQNIASWSEVTLGTLPSNIHVLSYTTADGGISGSDHHFTRCQWMVTTSGQIKLTAWEDSINTQAEPFAKLIVPIQLQ